ncbi:MAG TPA: hypothetical protein VIM53_03305 [Candidatus Saccharimonadales bacterium]
MRTALIIISSVLTIGGIAPYLVAVAKGETKPRLVSWFTWTLLTVIGCAATIADHDWASSVLLAAASLVTLSVVVFGLRYGDRKFERFDLVCQAAALLGITLWFVFNSPLIAVLASITIDAVGAAPSLLHCWQKPHEETAITFACGSVGALATLVAAHPFRLTAIAYPIYLVLMNGSFAAVIATRRKYAVAGEPAELREL